MTKTLHSSLALNRSRRSWTNAKRSPGRRVMDQRLRCLPSELGHLDESQTRMTPGYYAVIVPGRMWGVMSQLVQLEMPDRQTLWALIEVPEGPSDAGFTDAVTEKLHGFHESLRALATNTRSAVAAARPQEVTIEFGLELAAGKGGLVAALVGAGGTASIKVTLKWTNVDSESASAVTASAEQGNADDA